MDEDLQNLLRSILAADPDAPLSDDGREKVFHSMLAAHSRENFVALWRFADSLKEEFKRSHLLHALVRVVSERPIEHDLAERIARSIPDVYWRLSAMNQVAAELLKRAREFERFSPPSPELRARGLNLLREVEGELSSVPEQDGDRATILYGAGHSLVRAGELDWAEKLASTAEYCPENTDVLLASGKARLAHGQTVQAQQIARTVAELAVVGTGNCTNRVFDLEQASELVFKCGSKDEAEKYLEEAIEITLASQEARDAEAWKCLFAIATAFAKQAKPERAQAAANAITQPAQRELVLKKIAEVSAPS